MGEPARFSRAFIHTTHCISEEHARIDKDLAVEQICVSGNPIYENIARGQLNMKTIFLVSRDRFGRPGPSQSAHSSH